MTNKEKKEWLSVKYPLTIIRDRYDGVYSRACWLAFPLDYDEIPEDVTGDDVVCSLFWKTYEEPVGKGAYANDAVIDLMERMEVPEFPEESEDERIRKELIEFIKWSVDRHFMREDFHQAKRPPEWIAYLEKQKEEEGYEAIPVESTLEYKLGFKAGKESEKQKEQKSIKMEVYEVGKGTTICGQDYKCKKDYKEGNCWYIKDVIYHCGRDGYLTDQNGVSWSCTPEWFNEYIYTNSEWAEEEKTRFVSGQFLQCKLSFDDFKEGEHYWLEYVGDDMYVGRSDNILNQKFHITPRQLYTLFSQQLEENEKEQKPVEKEITLTDFEEVLNTFLFNFAHSSIEDCEPKEYIRKYSAEILKAAYKELNAQLKQDIFEAQQEGRREGYDAAKAEQKPAEWSEEDEKMKERLITRLNWITYNTRTDGTSPNITFF